MDNNDVKNRLAAATAALEETQKAVSEVMDEVNENTSLLTKALAGYRKEQQPEINAKFFADQIDKRGDNLSALAEQGHYEHELIVAVRGWMEHGYHADRAAFITSVYEVAVKAWDKTHYEYSLEQEVLLEDLEKQDIH